MGGYGAMRYSLAHPDLFGAAIVLSPAVYCPDAAERLQHTRVRGLRPGQEAVRRLDLQEAELSGPLRRRFEATGLSLPMFIAVGDDEFKNPTPKDYVHDLDFESHVLFNQAARVENLTTELRVVNGGHDWDVWGPEFAEGAKFIFKYLNQRR